MLFMKTFLNTFGNTAAFLVCIRNRQSMRTKINRTKCYSSTKNWKIQMTMDYILNISLPNFRRQNLHVCKLMQGLKISFFPREPNRIFKSYLKVLVYIETSTSLGSL